MILLLETPNVQVLWGSEAAHADEFGKISDFRVSHPPKFISRDS